MASSSGTGRSVLHAVLRRLGLADLISYGARSPWKRNQTFQDSAEYRRFARVIEAQVVAGVAHEVVASPDYSWGLRSGGRWFRDPTGRRIWRLLEPDGRFGGRWERVERPSFLTEFIRQRPTGALGESQPSVTFERQFQVWRYHVSHGQLLLQSNPTNEHPNRVEILFAGVLNMNVATLIDDLAVEVADAETAAKLMSNRGSWTHERAHAFLVSGRNFRGHVVCHTVEWHEADVPFHAPSALM